MPAGRIVPNPDRITAVGEIHHAPGIELLCSGERQLQVAEDARMAAADLKACDLGGADIKGVRPSPERTGAAA